MDKHTWTSLEERDFETMLEDFVPPLPPDEAVSGVTPWKRAMRSILAGLTLCTFTFQVWYLGYLLPAAGTILSLLGFRALRRENKWFQSCFILAAVRTALSFSVLALNTTVIQSPFSSLPLIQVLPAAALLMQIFCFWMGLRAVRRKCGLPPRAGSALALLFWYGLLCLLSAVSGSLGLALPAAVILLYVLILRSIYKLTGELDEAGYSVQAAPVRMTDRFLALTLVLALAAGCACGYLLGGSLPMDWKPETASRTPETERIRDRLSDLGFPGYVLEDLLPEEIAACDGALQVTAETETIDGMEDLLFTHVCVQLPGSQEEWIVFHHFLWTSDPGFYGTEAIQLLTAYDTMSHAWAPGEAPEGRVLYDRDGKTFASPYDFLGPRSFASFSAVFDMQQTQTSVFASFSLPAEGENCRGYITYSTRKLTDGYTAYSGINYTHQKSWRQYPAVTAMESEIRNGAFFSGGPFITVQTAVSLE